ncbi:DoxX-like family protein [Chitinophaga sp. CF118]|uniref:DoxX family protein n=1 Tax=Chitinophaga sp. CF118 TaxID=1884367 RepID=UPI0008E9D11D|nr:DoxX family protein [Chitinophaga sp. CF118]SFE07878.1 DoxX-like family protein [Chitinophaga sp. CF118]
MEKNKIIYWTTTGIISMVMLFSMYKMFTPSYNHLGFPDYFRIELLILKIVGLVVLLVPQIPLKIKEWAYAGFGIVLISASVAHFNSGDPFANAIEPLAFLVILAISNLYFYKIR